MAKGFIRKHYEDRAAILTLMRASQSAYALWDFMHFMADWNGEKYIFCLDPERIRRESGIGHNQIDDAKALLREYGWIVKVGSRTIPGHWNLAEYEVKVGKSVPPPKQGSKLSKSSQTSTPELGVNHQPPIRGHSGVSLTVAQAVRGGGVKKEEQSDDIAQRNVDATPHQHFPALSPSAENLKPETQPPPETPEGLRPSAATPPHLLVGAQGVSETKTSKSRKPEIHGLDLKSLTSDPEYLATLLYNYLQGRISLGDKTISVPRLWKKFWTEDFQSLLDGGRSRPDIEMVIWASQWPGNQKFYVRAQKIKENFDLLIEKAERRANLFRVHACSYCYCWFSMYSSLAEHLEKCTAAPPPTVLDDAAEEESWYVADDFLNQEGGAFGDPMDFDPFAETRFVPIQDENGDDVYGEAEPGVWKRVMIPEDWGQNDFNFTMPEPFTEPAKGSIRPAGEEVLPDWIRRARGVGAHSSHADDGNGGEEPPSQNF
jgi:hypothetical protein